ncbi:MAG: HAD family hydrolase [Chloroflexi bacterium]|nr:HAD family hydrolase [Chloroflexota bacterium]
MRPAFGVLWDLDGTLTDSVHLVIDTVNEVLRADGLPGLVVSEAGRLTGQPLDVMFRLASPLLTDDQVDSMRTRYRAIYDERAIPATRLFRGARATVRAFRAAGLKQATVTGKRARDCEKILRGLGLGGDIECFLGGDSVPRPKPAADLAERAARELGLAIGRCVVVGDTEADMGMGRAAGAHTIQVLWGFNRTRLPNADRAVRTWSELRRAVADLAER